MNSIPTDASTFTAGAFHPDLPGGQASGTLRVAEDGVHFESPKGNFSLPLAGLKLALGGANDQVIFFTHPGQPQATLHTADHAVLKHPRLAADHQLGAAVGRVRTQKRTALIVVASLLALLLASLVGLVLAKDRIVAAATSALPVAWEVSLGDQLFEQTRQREKMLVDPALDAQLKALTAPLLAGIKDARYPLQFHIVQDAELNAYAIPGGHVVIHSGLLLAADSAEQVAGVLAHEIAHVTLRHGFRSVLSSAGLYLVIQTFLGDLSGLMGMIVNNSAFLLDRKFSRDFEREADEAGWQYLLQARLNPRGMIEFFAKLAAEEQQLAGKDPLAGAAGSLAFLNTHPPTRERMTRLEARWQEVSARKDFQAIPVDYPAFKAALRVRLGPDAEKRSR
jgi:predicted Zn-dependent protease